MIMASFKTKISAMWLICFIFCSLVNEFVSSHDPGTEYIWSQDTDTDHMNTDDVLFSQPNDTELSSVKDDCERVLRRPKVEVVVPGKHLLKVMNTISTKTRAMFLQDYEHYFDTLKVGSTSRPMLLSYLGLNFASPEQLRSWYAPFKERGQGRIIDSCKSLLASREKSFNLSEKELEAIDKCKTGIKSRSHLAYLVFQNNLNLFMMDSYLLLCSKLEPSTIGDQVLI